MTGIVERSSYKYVNFETTHLAFVRRNQDQPNIQQSDEPLNGQQQHIEKTNSNFNSFITNLELGKLIPSHNITHHSLDNQYQSAQQLKRGLSSRRSNSTSSESSTSTLVEDCCAETDNHANRNDSKQQKENEQDLILVLPLSFSSPKLAEDNKDKNMVRRAKKKCCPVQCIDAMSTVSSGVYPVGSTPTSDCFEKSSLPFGKEISSSKICNIDEDRCLSQKRELSVLNTNTLPAKTPFKDTVNVHIAQCNLDTSSYKYLPPGGPKNTTGRNKDHAKYDHRSSPRVQQLFQSSFKEWLL